MANLRHGAWDKGIIIGTPGDADAIYLPLDRDRKGFSISVRYAPSISTQIQEWTWQPGPAGAGHGRQTPQSYAGGGSAYGKFVWLRSPGRAQPAGILQEVYLPKAITDLRDGYFVDALEYGTSRDLYFTTRGRYIMRIPGGTGTPEIAQDIGELTGNAAAQSIGIAAFNGRADNVECLYIGNPTGAIIEYDGTTWTAGETTGDGTTRALLNVPFWTISSALATGGESGNAGKQANRLVGTNAAGTGFYHVSGDPKKEADWSALEKVGANAITHPIVSTAQDNHTVWFGKTDGAWGVNGQGYAANLTDWMRRSTSIRNNRAMAFWNGLIWLGTESGLSAFEPSGERVDLASYVQFGAGGSNTSPIFGRPRVLAPSPEGMYVGYFDGQSSYIGMLKVLPDGSYLWSMAECVIGGGQEVTFVQQTTPADGIPRLWIGTIGTDSVMHLYWQMLPVSGDPELDLYRLGTFKSAEQWEVTLPEWDAGRPVPLLLRKYVLNASHLGTAYPANRVEFQVKIDDGDFEVQGEAARSRWTSTPTAGRTDANVVQVRLVVSNSGPNSVIIRGAEVDYSLNPPVTEFTTYPIEFAVGKMKGADDPAAVLRKAIRVQTDGAISYVNHIGETVRGFVEGVETVEFTEEAPGKGWVAHLDMVISRTARDAIFDGPDTWDDAAFS